MTEATPTRRGRPKTFIVDRLRVSLWSHSVLLASGLKEVQELEALFDKTPRLRLAKGLWSRYMRGEVLPQGSLAPDGPDTLVERVGKLFPRTIGVFYAPFWELLVWNPVTDLESYKALYLTLQDEVNVQFVARDELDGERAPTKYDQFWYRQRSIDARRKLLATLGDWDKLLVCLLEAKMSYFAQNVESFTDSQMMACKVIEHLQKAPELQAKRVQGVLLTMEALCLDTLVINIAAHTPLNDTQYHARVRLRDMVKLWNLKRHAHADGLSSKSRLAFVQTLEKNSLVARRRGH